MKKKNSGGEMIQPSRNSIPKNKHQLMQQMHPFRGVNRAFKLFLILMFLLWFVLTN